jgi:hypothetical protein
MVDKGPAADGTADISAYLTTATPYDRNTAQKLRRVGAAWGGQQPGTAPQETTLPRAGHRRDQTVEGDTPPSGRRLAALLSCVGVGGYEERAMGQRKVSGCGVRLVRECG